MHGVRNLLWLVVLLPLLIALTGCDGSGSNGDPNIRVYRSDADGFSIRFPRPWGIAENTRGMVVVATSPEENSFDTYRENVGVVVAPLSYPLPSLQTYHLANIGALTVQTANFKLLEEGDTTIDGSLAKWLLFTYTYNSQELQCLEFEKIQNGRAYVVICTSLPATFAGYEAIFNEIGKSLDLYSPRSVLTSNRTAPATTADEQVNPCIRALMSAAK